MSHFRFVRYTLLLFSVFTLQHAVFAEPPNLANLVKEVKAYHDKGAYQKDLSQVINNARDFINERAAKNKLQLEPKKLAIVLDIDETSLSNYNEMVANEFTYSKVRWRKAVFAANAPSIKPMLSLYQDAIKHDISVFFVTGRHESAKEPTIKNLKNAGYQGWTALYLRPENYTQKSIIPFKSGLRKNLVQQGFTIIASIGDQYSDLQGGYTEKTFKLPNPYYYIP